MRVLGRSRRCSIASVLGSGSALDRSRSAGCARSAPAGADGRALSMGPHAVARLAATFGVMPRLGADCVQVPIRQGPIRIVSKRFVEAAHRARLAVHVWTINDEATINELLDSGVDGVMSDRIRQLREVFTRRGLPLTG
jgi:glycerophosphoryl diester phosphodiesterase